MKSAYGRQTPPPDYELTYVEQGSPMGELLRRYWQPVCTSDELRDLPKKVKLLCKELVVFRDKRGRVGALEPHCSHRGTSLEWGRVEGEGLRCCYHGWLYDTRGQCIDMPRETEEFRRRMDVCHPAYPTTEYGGLVFVYMGPPGTEPLFPMYDIIDTRHRDDVVLRGMLFRRLRQRLQLAAALREHCRSVASVGAAPDDQRRPVRGSADAGCTTDRV